MNKTRCIILKKRNNLKEKQEKYMSNTYFQGNGDSFHLFLVFCAYVSISGAVGADCCVHCILACLFCEFLTLCNMVVAQASCGTCTSEACCCCCCADDLGDDCNCPCDMDCGIMDACCESSDCLEICMECCGICFPT